MFYDSLRAFTGDGLVASDGAFWLRQRRMMQSHFHRKHLATLTDLIVAAIAEELDAWASAAEWGTPFNLLPAYNGITVETRFTTRRKRRGTRASSHRVDKC